MKRLALVSLVLLVSFSIFAGGTQEEAESKYKIAWYASAVHPYFDEVQGGVKAFETDTGIAVHQQIGPDWTQDSQTQNIDPSIEPVPSKRSEKFLDHDNSLSK